jgi:ABC-2 type transport system ATP-binding protein
MSNEEAPVIEVSHLTKDYGFGRGVFDVSILVHRGECYGYLGPNGAGKSTTIRHIMGFSKPTSGYTRIFGIDTFGHTDEILDRVGYLPGEVALPSGLTGNQFLKMMGQLRGGINENMLHYLLDKFELDPSQDTKRMSLGVKRKLAVVAAFMNDPDVLILDEPTSGLDPLMQRRFIDFVLEMKEKGKTVLVSSHIFSEVDAMCDTITVIKDGRHVSTIRASDFKNADIKKYALTFENPAEKASFIQENPYWLIKDNPGEGLELPIAVPKNDLDKLFATLAHYALKKFEEITFSLEQYFMSFYKEDKKFGGLSGIEGNTQHGQ